MNQFNWIKSKTEFNAVLAYFDNFIKEMQSMRDDTPNLQDIYIKNIIKRDELLDFGISKGY